MVRRRLYRVRCVPLLMILSGLAFFSCPYSFGAQYPSQSPASPPVELEFVRQGEFALALAYGLGLTDDRNELQAIEMLASLGITPVNGWISDDPVTPDVIGDLEAATAYAADTNLLALSREEAVMRFANVLEESGIPVTPGAGAYIPEGSVSYPTPPDIADYYHLEGPPVITCYAPPPAYYYLYSWVPYTFWYSGSVFSGYYILRDHHRHRKHERHASHAWRSRFGHNHGPDEHYRFSRKTTAHLPRPTIWPHQWNQAGPSGNSIVPSAGSVRSRSGAPNARVAPVLSGQPARIPRETHLKPRPAQPSAGTVRRFSSSPTVHAPAAPRARSLGIRRGSDLAPHLRSRTPIG